MPHHLTPSTAHRHEALHLRLAALIAQAKPLAAKTPDGAVPAGVARVAADILVDARSFLPRRRRTRLPMTAPCWAGLAAELAGVAAALEAFELRHTAWDPAQKCRVWRTAGDPLPVERHYPQPLSVARSARPGELSDIHRKLIERIQNLKRAAFSSPAERGRGTGEAGGGGAPDSEPAVGPSPSMGERGTRPDEDEARSTESQ